MPIAIVTGASRGIGSAIVTLLCQNGFDIAMCARNEETLLAFKNNLLAQYPNRTIYTEAIDVSNKEAVINFGKNCLALFTKIDILVNNAGVFLPGNILDENDTQLQSTLDTNLLSAYYLTKVIAPNMIDHQEGHIFNICSVASLKAYPNGGSYSISKYALLGFSDNIRLELQSYKVKVTAICPGAVYTDSWKDAPVSADRLMDVNDVAQVLYNTYQLSPHAVVEMRPQFGDL